MAPRRQRPHWQVSLSTSLYSWLEALVWIPIALALIFTFLGRVTPVSGSSMLPTLHDRDIMLVTCLGYHPRPGDVVVLTKSFRDSDTIVKRVIATGGQRVDIDYTAGTVTVDGMVLSEPYVDALMEEPWYPDQRSLTVPDGSVFVMGDNRNHSNDSRDLALGTVDERYILGKACLVFFPFRNLTLL